MDKIIRLCFVLTCVASIVAMAAGIGHLGLASVGSALCLSPLVAWILATFVVRSPYERALDYQEAERNWHRAQDAVRRAELSERFELRGWPPLIAGLIFLAVAIAIATFGAWIGAWPAVSFAVLLALLGSPAFLRNIPHLNGPLLSCDARGFRSGAYSEFSWEEIEGISLQSYTARGITFYTLLMRVPGLMQRLNRMHPCVRLLHRCLPKRRQDRLQFRLTMCGEAPRVVELVCFTLWERAVGTKPAWFPDDPRAERELQALKQRFEEEDRLVTGMVERELARHGLPLPESFRREAGSQPGSKSFRDRLARSRPIENAQKEREMARIPAYRTAAVFSLLLIGGLLALAFRAVSNAPL